VIVIVFNFPKSFCCFTIADIEIHLSIKSQYLKDVGFKNISYLVKVFGTDIFCLLQLAIALEANAQPLSNIFLSIVPKVT